jgi:hypothetical protein
MLTNIHQQTGFLAMAALTISLRLAGQDGTLPILSSHDRIGGPVAGAHQIEDLQVFANGKVVYTEESSKEAGSRKPGKSVYTLRIGSDEMRNLAEMLDSAEIRSLPQSIPAVMRPIDFFWQKSLKIAHGSEIQPIDIENFYPFVNMRQAIYPTALIRLECRIQDIKATAAKRSKDDNAWCEALTAPRETGTAIRTAHCAPDSAQPKIIPGEGWGPVRIGASSKAVDALLGKMQAGNGYKDGYFKEYAPKGIQVNFNAKTNTVQAIFFYNGQRGDEQIGFFCGETLNGVGWQSSVEDVKHAFGNPKAEYSGADSVRLEFDGIDFRFEDGKMVRIGIPGR